jgi:hypothetical protein
MNLPKVNSGGYFEFYISNRSSHAADWISDQTSKNSFHNYFRRPK